MKRIRIIGLVLVAALAISAVATAAASAALPEFYQKGSPLTKKTAFAGTASVSKLVGSLATVECNSDSSKGDLLNSKEAGKIKITYSGCSIPALGVKCETKKAKPGVITTEDLDALLVYSSETVGGSEVASEEFTPESEAAEPTFAKFSCDEGAIPIVVTGSVLGEGSPINTEATSGEVILREKATETESGCGKQQLLYVEAAAPCHHLTALGAPSWEVTKESITFAKATELRA
jgi:hypothetical protein